MLLRRAVRKGAIHTLKRDIVVWDRHLRRYGEHQLGDQQVKHLKTQQH